jgi:hypothetical protein
MSTFTHYEIDALGVRAIRRHRLPTLAEALDDALSRCIREWDEAEVYGVETDGTRVRLAVAGCDHEWIGHIADVRGSVPVEIHPPFEGAWTDHGDGPDQDSSTLRARRSAPTPGARPKDRSRVRSRVTCRTIIYDW